MSTTTCIWSASPARGQEWYGDYVYTKEPHTGGSRFLAPFHPQPRWARPRSIGGCVVRKTGEDENGKPVGVDIGPQRGALVLDPKPEGSRTGGQSVNKE